MMLAKIVPANQPISGNLLEEFKMNLPPQSDAGIRLGWDDEQILVGICVQMIEKPIKNQVLKKRIDAPLGWWDINIDVRQVAIRKFQWESLNSVENSTESKIVSGQLDSSQSRTSHTKSIQLKISGPNSDHYWFLLLCTLHRQKSLVTKDNGLQNPIRNHEQKWKSAKIRQQIRMVIQNQGFDSLFDKTETSLRKFLWIRIRLSDISEEDLVWTDSSNQFSSKFQSTRCAFKRYVESRNASYSKKPLKQK